MEKVHAKLIMDLAFDRLIFKCYLLKTNSKNLDYKGLKQYMNQTTHITYPIM